MYPSDIAFTPTVKSIQESQGSRKSYAKMEQGSGWQTKVTPDLESFLATLDMFYLGSANESGQPYIQYRGGPKGFLKVVDESTLGFAEFGGNQQFITTGNLQDNPKAFIFLMDYANQKRVKLWGRARVVEDQKLTDQLSDPSYHAQPQRAILFEIEAWDINCPQHIHRRIPLSEIHPVIETLQSRINGLEEELKRLRTQESD